jgi:hypothetical protein
MFSTAAATETKTSGPDTEKLRKEKEPDRYFKNTDGGYLM